ncbi:MAG: ABC transporter permease [Candidatus Zixiibacteriota bacterium]|nr:MAG: ABC transporter permease [candidate division Zixibacteria bacterium]
MISIIAWRNVWRNKLRSSVIILAITLGIWSGMIIVGLMTGMTSERLHSAVAYETSHIQIHKPKFLDNTELQYFIPNADSIMEVIRKNPKVTATSSRLITGGMANTAYTGTGIVIMGINPEKEKTVTEIFKTIPDSNGTYFKTKKRYPVVIGQNLAKKLKAKLKSKIVLTFQDAEGNLTGGAFRVVGIYKTNNSMFDETNLFVKKRDLAKLLGISDKAAHEIAIMTNGLDLVAPVKNQISKQFPNLLVQQWEDIQPDLSMVNEYMKAMFFIFMMIILLALGFAIVNTMLMAILERTRELGMLMAVGMNKRKIFNMIMFETAYLTIIGGIVGMILSFLTLHYLSANGLDLSIFAQGLESVGYPSIIYPDVTLSDYLYLTIMIIFTGMLASVYPARKALKKNPSEAIRTL